MSVPVRVFVSVAVQLSFLVLGVAFLHYEMGSQKILSATLLQSLTLNSADSIPYYIDDAISQSEKWVLLLGLECIVISLAWLFFANTLSPAGPTQARSRLAGWFASLFLLISAGAALGWWMFKHKNIAANLSEHFLTPLLLISAAGALFAFYLGTALGVKPSMRPSVPLADAWLR